MTRCPLNAWDAGLELLNWLDHLGYEWVKRLSGGIAKIFDNLDSHKGKSLKCLQDGVTFCTRIDIVHLEALVQPAREAGS